MLKLLKLFIFTTLLSSCAQVHLKYRTKLIGAKSNGQKFDIYKQQFHDKEMQANIYTYYEDHMYMAIENLAKTDIEIVWSQSNYIDIHGKKHPVVPNGTSNKENPRDLKNTKVIPGETHINNFNNYDAVVFTKFGGWKDYGFIKNVFPNGKSDAKAYGKAAKGKSFFINLVLQKQEKKKKYKIKYKIRRYKIDKNKS